MRRAIGAAFALLLAVSACTQPAPQAVTPALWEVTGPGGEQGWLFGTIHALPGPVAWRSKKIERALAESDRLVLEIDNADDPAALAKVFARLSRTPGQLPVEQRVPAASRPQLERLLEKSGLSGQRFDDVETWAVAITLSQAAAKDMDSRHGIDRAIMHAVPDKPIVELEGAETQLRIFDSLPEKEQADLLAGVVRDAGDGAMQGRLSTAWESGDMAAIEAETKSGLLTDPELRAALLVDRNAQWADKLAAMLKSGARPVVAVGAAHMAGPDGLPALLAARGFTVTRIQ